MGYEWLLLIPLILIAEPAAGALCGPDAVPHRFSVYPNGQVMIGCSKPTCFNIQSADIGQGAFYRAISSGAGLSQAVENAENFHLSIIECSSVPVDQQCPADTAVFQNEPNATTNSYIVCCKNQHTKFTHDNIASVSTGQEIVGGKILDNGQQIAFDYISDVNRNVSNGEQITYQVHTRRIYCPARAFAGNAASAQQPEFQAPPAQQDPNAQAAQQPENNSPSQSAQQADNFRAQGVQNQIVGYSSQSVNQFPSASVQQQSSSQSFNPFQNYAGKGYQSSSVAQFGGYGPQQSGLADPSYLTGLSSAYQGRPRAYSGGGPCIGDGCGGGGGGYPVAGGVGCGGGGCGGGGGYPVAGFGGGGGCGGCDACGPPPAPACNPCCGGGGGGGGGGGAFCFSGDTEVITKDGEVKRMDELKVGDWVMTEENGRAMFTKVKTWMHRLPEQKADFIKMTLSDGSSLKITPHHFIYKTECTAIGERVEQLPDDAVLSEQVKPGDCLYTLAKGTHHFIQSRVENIEIVTEHGIYSPMTDKGDIVVNNVAASCYSVTRSQAIQTTFFKLFEYMNAASRQIFGRSDSLETDLPLSSQVIFQMMELLMPIKGF